MILILTAASFLPFDLLHYKLLLEDQLLECKFILQHFSLIRYQAIHPLLVTRSDPITIRVVKLGIMMLLLVCLYSILISPLLELVASVLFLPFKTTSLSLPTAAWLTQHLAHPVTCVPPLHVSPLESAHYLSGEPHSAHGRSSAMAAEAACSA